MMQETQGKALSKQQLRVAAAVESLKVISTPESQCFSSPPPANVRNELATDSPALRSLLEDAWIR